jgi:transposase
MHLDDEPRWHQVFDVPPMRARVDEYRIYSGRCKVCGKADAGALPAGVPTGQIGPRALALVGVLGTRYHLTQRKIRNLLAQLVGLDFSVGAISQAQGKVANALKTPVAQAASALASAPALWMDETTYPREGRTNWVWAAVQPKLAVFSVFPSRARYVLLELVGQNSAAVITSDRYAAYACVDPARRQVCWAHLLRDFNRIGQRAGQAGKVGERLLGLGLVMFRLRERGALQGPRLEGLQRRFKATLERGVGQTACTRTANTCANLLHLWPSLWTFTADASLAPTNNAAEQALRSLVLKRKISGPTRSLRGDQFLARGYTPACGKGAICGTSCIRRCGPSLPGP